MTDGDPVRPAPPETTVSEVTDADEGAVVALWHACGLTRPWNDPHDDLRRARDEPTSTVLVLRAAPDGAPGAPGPGAVVGTVMVGHDGHRGWLYYVAVAPQVQGLGLGRALVVAAEAWLVACGVPKVQLLVRSTNAAVLGFYDTLGYTDQDCTVLGRRLDDQLPPAPGAAGSSAPHVESA